MTKERLISDLEGNRGYSGIPTFMRSKICTDLNKIEAGEIFYYVNENSFYFLTNILFQ